MITFTSFTDTRFFKPRDEWRIMNIPPFNYEFEDWLIARIPETKIERFYGRTRSHGGYGNKGGWFDKPTKIELTFPSESAELYFRMKWDLISADREASSENRPEQA